MNYYYILFINIYILLQLKLELIESVYQFVDLEDSDKSEFEFIDLTQSGYFVNAYEVGMKICDKDAPFGSEFEGVQGALTFGCCAALFYLSSTLAYREMLNNNIKAILTPDFSIYDKGFIYIETGSFLGLSAHIVAAGLKYAGTSGLIYCHDLFDDGNEYTSIGEDGTTSLWQNNLLTDNKNESRLNRFYNNIRRNNLEHFVIPIQGDSSKTLKIHPNESAHLIFIDGSHTYENVYKDLIEAWRILKPGGILIGHDCLPESIENITVEEKNEKRGVRKAVKQFAKEKNVKWYIIAITMYMFYIEKI